MLGLLCSCKGMQQEEVKRFTPAKDAIATVNGVAITEADIRLATRSEGHQTELPTENQRVVLENVIRDELAAQKAVALGLGADKTVQDELRQMEAQLSAMKRKRLADVYFRDQLGKRGDVSEADAKRYFDENAALIRTEVKVWQILMRDEARIALAKQEIAAGTPFDEVAKRQFPGMPEGQKPWELDYLRWNQVPEAWRSVVYGLKEGETSGVIKGPSKRFWVIKLVGKRENSEATFESLKSTILETMKTTKAEQLRAELDRELRQKARIVYTTK